MLINNQVRYIWSRSTALILGKNIYYIFNSFVLVLALKTSQDMIISCDIIQILIQKEQKYCIWGPLCSVLFEKGIKVGMSLMVN